MARFKLALEYAGTRCRGWQVQANARTEVGRGALSPPDIPLLLAGATGRPAELTAPPSGLFLEAVLYPGDRFDRPLRSAVAVDRGTR